MKKALTKKKGFTLLETLVAIAVMTVALGAAFATASKSLGTSYTSRNQAIASFLTAEGIELVRTVRDNVAHYNKNNGASIDWLDPLRSVCFSGCDIDPTSTGLYLSGGSIVSPNAISSCGASGCVLKSVSLGGTRSAYTSGTIAGTDTRFARLIRINETVHTDGSGKKEAVVTVTVWWSGGQHVSLTETLTNWH